MDTQLPQESPQSPTPPMGVSTQAQITTPLPKKERELTLKQRKWIKVYIQTGNATEAARRAYDCKGESAHSIGSENLLKLAFPDLMEEMGLTDVALLNIGAEGLQSKKGTMSGEIIPDYKVRHQYWETMLKLKGRLRDKIVDENLPDISFDLYGNTIIKVNQSAT